MRFYDRILFWSWSGTEFKNSYSSVIEWTWIWCTSQPAAKDKLHCCCICTRGPGYMYVGIKTRVSRFQIDSTVHVHMCTDELSVSTPHAPQEQRCNLWSQLARPRFWCPRYHSMVNMPSHQTSSHPLLWTHLTCFNVRCSELKVQFVIRYSRAQPIEYSIHSIVRNWRIEILAE